MVIAAGVCERDPMSLGALLTIQKLGGDRFQAPGGSYPWGWTYGGQLVAQAVCAAAQTVDASAAINSLHAHYIRAGENETPVGLAVSRVRDGRAFAVRSVSVSQGPRELAVLLASFHRPEPSDERQPLTSPAVAPPEALVSDSWTPLFDRRDVPTCDSARLVSWMRLSEPPPGTSLLRACALAYMADDLFDDPVIGMLGLRRRGDEVRAGAPFPLSTQSLDYGLWFHRPAPLDEWLLFDYRCQTLVGACAMVAGEVFDRAGAHIATAAQQVLVRQTPTASAAPAGLVR